MSLQSFHIENNKAIQLAFADHVPPVMVITGPNGVGKSTLLYAIRQGSGVVTDGTRVLYQGPHRVLRRTTVSRKWLSGSVARWFTDLLTSSDVSGFEGLSFGNAERTPDNVDEAGSTIKHTLGKVENRRQTLHTELFDKLKADGETIDPSSIPDVYEPLKDLTKYLLPHLRFKKVDFKNEDNIGSLWLREDQNQTSDVDIDDLSSGEKSIVVLFLPLIEDQIKDRLQKLENLIAGVETGEVETADRVFIIDEPEQHLHPDLQAKLLSYIRRLSRDSATQFVLSTHSPTILDQASNDELFILAPPGGAAENQLKKVATSLERLEALKELAGNAYVLTSGRTIVCIEGESRPPDEMSDLSLLELMYPRATAFTLVPTGGKGNVISTVTRFREHLPEGQLNIQVKGLVDSDNTEENPPEGISTLPVCMIENLLLDREVLYAYCLKVGVNTFENAQSVEDELNIILQGLRSKEISRRVAKELKAQTVRISGATAEEIQAEHAVAMERIRSIVPDDARIDQIIQNATAKVDGLLADGSAINSFHGKTILKEFYQRNIQPHNISYSDMALDIAKAIGDNEAIAARLNDIFDNLAG